MINYENSSMSEGISVLESAWKAHMFTRNCSELKSNGSFNHRSRIRILRIFSFL